MLTRLRLRTRLVSGDKQQRSVHDGGTVQHRSHENVVTWAINEGDVADEGHLAVAPWALTGWAVFFIGLIGTIAARTGAGGVVAFVDLK